MSALSKKDTRTLLRHLTGQGARVESTKKGVRVLFPNGSTLAMHWTESDHRAVLNNRAAVRRAGFTWPFDHQRKVHPMGASLTPERQLDLAAAIELVGHTPTTITAVAEHAGVSQPTARKGMVKAGFQQITRTSWYLPEAPAPGFQPTNEDLELPSDPVEATPYPEIDLARRIVARASTQPTPPAPPVLEPTSWIITTPAELQAMARQMGLEIEVRVWRASTEPNNPHE